MGKVSTRDLELSGVSVFDATHEYSPSSSILFCSSGSILFLSILRVMVSEKVSASEKLGGERGREGE